MYGNPHVHVYTLPTSTGVPTVDMNCWNQEPFESFHQVRGCAQNGWFSFIWSLGHRDFCYNPSHFRSSSWLFLVLFVWSFFYRTTGIESSQGSWEPSSPRIEPDVRLSPKTVESKSTHWCFFFNEIHLEFGQQGWTYMWTCLSLKEWNGERVTLNLVKFLDVPWTSR